MFLLGRHSPATQSSALSQSLLDGNAKRTSSSSSHHRQPSHVLSASSSAFASAAVSGASTPSLSTSSPPSPHTRLSSLLSLGSSASSSSPPTNTFSSTLAPPNLHLTGPTNTITPDALAARLLPPLPHLRVSESAASTVSDITPRSYTPTGRSISSTAAAITGTTSVLVEDERIEVDAYDALTAALVPDALLSLTYRTHYSRYWVLLLYCSVSALQGMLYCTFSTIPDYFNAYFQQPTRDQRLLDLLLNWSPIVYIPTILLAARLAQYTEGLRRSVLLAGLFCAVGATIRMVPSLLSSRTREQDMAWMIWMLHAGQIVNALAAPLLLAVPSKLSVVWFADSERSLATALATISNGFGIGLAYLVFPIVFAGRAGVEGSASDVLDATDAKMPVLLQVTAIVAAVPFVLACLYFPDHPASFPSPAAAQRHYNPSLSSLAPQAISFSSGLCRTLLTPSFVLLILSTGINTGVYSVWSTTLPSTLSNTGLSLQQSASLVSATRFAGIVGGLAGGWVAGLASMRRRYKPLLCVFLYLSLVSFTVFTLTQPSIGVPSAVLPANWYLLSFVSVSCGGLFLGATIPLSYELGAELTYPAVESTSAACIGLVMAASSLVMLSVSPTLAQSIAQGGRGTSVQTINSVMVITVAVGSLLLFLVRERYLRLEAGRTYATRNEGVAAVLSYYSQLEEAVSPSGIVSARHQTQRDRLTRAQSDVGGSERSSAEKEEGGDERKEATGGEQAMASEQHQQQQRNSRMQRVTLKKGVTSKSGT